MFEPSDTKQYKTIMAKISSLALCFLPTQQVRAAFDYLSKKKWFMSQQKCERNSCENCRTGMHRAKRSEELI
jgi:hypothetical protein